VLFTSLEFFAFLPLTLLVWGLLPVARRPAWLLLASCIFYGAARPSHLAYLGAVTLVAWASAWAMERAARPSVRKLFLGGGLVLVLGSLLAFKFYDFVAAELEPVLSLPRLGVVAPAGYSFYAFSAAAYLVDAHARRLPGAPRAAGLALYLAFFPKVLAGPIERAPAFLAHVAEGLRADPARWALGLQLVGWGLLKKVVIADNLAPFVDRTFGIAAFASPIDLLVAVYFFSFQIYCDFSGYTDVALGAALLLGVRLGENFRRPYLARSTAEFWSERWHVSLGRWFRDYLYLPLGGSRTGPLRHALNLMAVFLVSGLWHAGLGYGVGYTFLAWGALNGVYQWGGLATGPVLRRLGERLPRLGRSLALRVLRVVWTFHLIAVSWVFFRARSLGDAWLVLRKVGARLSEMPSLLARYPFTTEQITGFALIAFLLGIEIVDERRPIFQRLAAAPVAVRWGTYYLALLALLALGRWGGREFIYMQF